MPQHKSSQADPMGGDDRKTAMFRDLEARISQRLSATEARTAADFAKIYLRHVPSDDMERRDAEDMYGSVLSLWKWVCKHKAGTATPSIRVYNPSLDRDGWRSTHTVIEIVNDDMPFLVDSVLMEMNRRNLSVHWLAHPVLGVTRDAKGHPREIVWNVAGTGAESVIHLEVDEQTGPEMLQEITEALRRVLADVRMAYGDWGKMLDRADALAREMETDPPAALEAEETNEAAAFLRWLCDGNFTFLGYRQVEYHGRGAAMRFLAEAGTGLGLLRDDARGLLDRPGDRTETALPARIAKKLMLAEAIRIYKSDAPSTVHRGAYMDIIAVTRFNAAGKPIGEHLFAGLLTSLAYTQSVRKIPLLRKKVTALLSQAGQSENGHFVNQLLHVVNQYPRDELFQIDMKRLAEIAFGTVNVNRRRQIGVFMRLDFFEHHISALVFIPRDRFSTRLRKRVGRILEEGFDGRIVAQHSHMSDSPLARVHLVMRIPAHRAPEDAAQKVTAQIMEACRSWEDRLRQGLIETHGEEKGVTLYQRYESAFPLAYRENIDIRTAIQDIARLEEWRQTGLPRARLSRPIEAPEHELRLRVYDADGAIVLSEVVPILENMGVRTLETAPYDISPADGPAAALHEFFLCAADSRAVDIPRVQETFQEAFLRVCRGEAENDRLNRLILTVGLSWREVMIIRACEKYLRQTGIPFSQEYMGDTLVRNPDFAADLVALFRRRFDPDLDPEKGETEQQITDRYLARLDGVANLDEDRILRRFLNVVLSMLRTGYYQQAADGAPKPYLAFKLDSRALEELPRPAPFCEIFVYSPRFEAVHLRFGRVARGGIRWSDRREDFRTEILGLVKAQQEKNAVIVPVGAKGGFVLKKAPAPSEREAFLAEGVACYKQFIQAMLDLTDMPDAEGTVHPPQRVVRKDGDDPYLVVAADKGTAAFSDYANAISKANGFWLGDAFASGGSSGYDHKKMAITARGGWESVKRHFREMDHDIQSQPFTVIGVGDMGGDVFGNAMLLSRHIRLIGAFNHRHIFLDPDPDPETSFAERQRLFDCGGDWDAYDRRLISAGGGVFSRAAKSVELNPQLRVLLGVQERKLTPAALIHALLKARADLLWFGGIGTYVKDAEESDADVGDRANDALRINAGELQVRVIGEGANLGMTQRARIAFARHGGRINTDAVDNSAGVNCSDHEVNIKILLDDVVRRGDMTEKQRNSLLKRMTDEVAQLVLRNNYQQTLSISVTRAHAAKLLDRHQRLIRALEKAGFLDRALGVLPDDEEIAARMKAREGLSRPELATLLAYAKNSAYQQLLESDLPDDPLLQRDLLRYFPLPLQKDFADLIHAHPLRREIIATSVTNSMLNRTDPGFVVEMASRTSRTPADVARAYSIVREVFDLQDLWSRIEALDNSASAAVQIAMFGESRATITRMTDWFLRNGDDPLDINANIARYKPGVQTLRENLTDILGALVREKLARRVARFRVEGVPEELADWVGSLRILSGTCDVVRLALAAQAPVRDVGAVYTAVGERLGMDWLRSVIAAAAADNTWQHMALSALIDDLWGLQSALTGRIIRECDMCRSSLDAWEAANVRAMERVDGLLHDLRAVSQPDLAMLSVMVRELRVLVAE